MPNYFAGRILSLCLKQSPIIDELAIYDACAPDARSMMLDLSLMSTRCRTYDVDDQASGEAGLKRVLDNAKIVVFVSDRGKALEQDALNLHLYVPWILAYCPKVRGNRQNYYFGSFNFTNYEQPTLHVCAPVFGLKRKKKRSKLKTTSRFSRLPYQRQRANNLHNRRRRRAQETGSRGGFYVIKILSGGGGLGMSVGTEILAKQRGFSEARGI